MSVVFSLDISANPVTMEAFRELKIVMVVPVDDPRTSAVCNPYSFGNCVKTHNRNHHNPFDTLKASMVRGLRPSGSQKCCWDPVDDPQPSGEFIFSKTG